MLLASVGGVGYWRIYPKQPQFAPQIAAPFKAPPTVTSPVTAIVSPRPSPRLVIGMPQLADNHPSDEPATPLVAAPPMTTPAAEAPASVPATAIPQVLAAASPDATPADNIFVVRFDSKLPGLTPSGLRTLNAALRATNKGEKVRIEIDGCAAHYGLPTGIDCPALTRSLMRILAHRGVDHPANLVASADRPTLLFPW